MWRRQCEFMLEEGAWPEQVDAALTGDACAIITANLRDFPARALSAMGLRAIHPDEFLCDLYLNHPDQITDAIAATAARARAAGGDLTAADLLRRARLPRLAKSIARFQAS